MSLNLFDHQDQVFRESPLAFISLVTTSPSLYFHHWWIDNFGTWISLFNSAFHTTVTIPCLLQVFSQSCRWPQAKLWFCDHLPFNKFDLKSVSASMFQQLFTLTVLCKGKCPVIGSSKMHKMHALMTLAQMLHIPWTTNETSSFMGQHNSGSESLVSYQDNSESVSG